MRALRIPVFVLIVLLCACLCSNIRMNMLCHGWAEELDSAKAAVEKCDFDGADKALRKLEEDWAHRQTYLHITIEHSELDNTRELIDLCRLQIRQADPSAFLTTVARLQAQLDLLREMEELSIKNIL